MFFVHSFSSLRLGNTYLKVSFLKFSLVFFGNLLENSFGNSFHICTAVSLGVASAISFEILLDFFL